MKPLRRFLLGLLVLVGAGVNAQEAAWPPLPKQGFSSGHTATRADVAKGNAVFVPEVGGVSVGRPLAIVIPQYAYYKEEGKKEPVIVIQAEEVQGMKMLGARRTNGKHVVGLLENFELLGRTPPRR
jgi:hypothetical protein